MQQMEGMSLWLQESTSAAARLLGQLIEYIPSLVGATLVLLVGLVVARLLRAAGARLAIGANRLMERAIGRRQARRLALSPVAIGLVSNVVFWIVILFSITAATRILGLAAFSEWLGRIVAYLPTLVAGGLIVLAGTLISVLARDLTVAAVASAGVAYSELFGRAVQGAILATALVLGINQIGIDVTLLVTLIAIAVAAVLGAFALAFALGARVFVSNLIGAHYLQRQYQVGQVARLGNIEGEILEVTPTSIVLATQRGRVNVPGKVFNEEATTLLQKALDHA